MRGPPLTHEHIIEKIDIFMSLFSVCLGDFDWCGSSICKRSIIIKIQDPMKINQAYKNLYFYPCTHQENPFFYYDTKHS